MVMHIDVNIGQTYSSWTVPGDPANLFGSIAFGSVALSNNGRFVVAFVGHSISLWDTSTSARISSDIRRTAHIWSIALSSDDNYLAVSDANNKITLLNLNDIISNYYLVGQGAAQPHQNRRVEDLQPQNADLRGKLNALELRVDELSQGTTWSHELLRAEQPIPLRILDGNYRIKSKTRDLCLTWSEDGSGRVCAQSNESSPFQVVCHHFLWPGLYALIVDPDSGPYLPLPMEPTASCVIDATRTR
ncbi:hypothetical protein JVT61DRAFT_14235 [Boletus reticuloceps]|uniref:Uncharacterized protein n=1 Tax=Boletus reticuloceps TaxID=495285 RepID=A0A8I2YCV4_9AGAM|nr:hypothetical protein JVT61DRAFT_14235 [Boletus reticuloceps]